MYFEYFQVIGKWGMVVVLLSLDPEANELDTKPRIADIILATWGLLESNIGILLSLI